MKPGCVTIQMKATEQYFHVVLFIMLFIMLYKVFKSERNPSMWPFKWKLLKGTFIYLLNDIVRY